MASEKEANVAREKHSQYLRELGAHGIGVEEVKRKGEKSYAVIAYFDEAPESLPDKLTIKAGKKTLDVPLLARIVEKFKAE